MSFFWGFEMEEEKFVVQGGIKEKSKEIEKQENSYREFDKQPQQQKS